MHQHFYLKWVRYVRYHGRGIPVRARSSKIRAALCAGSFMFFCETMFLFVKPTLAGQARLLSKSDLLIVTKSPPTIGCAYTPSLTIIGVFFCPAFRALFPTNPILFAFIHYIAQRWIKFCKSHFCRPTTTYLSMPRFPHPVCLTLSRPLHVNTCSSQSFLLLSRTLRYINWRVHWRSTALKWTNELSNPVLFSAWIKLGLVLNRLFNLQEGQQQGKSTKFHFVLFCSFQLTNLNGGRPH